MNKTKRKRFYLEISEETHTRFSKFCDVKGLVRLDAANRAVISFLKKGQSVSPMKKLETAFGSRRK